MGDMGNGNYISYIAFGSVGSWNVPCSGKILQEMQNILKNPKYQEKIFPKRRFVLAGALK